MRRFLPLVLLLTMLATASFAQTSLGGKVTDAETKEELIGANVVLYKGGTYATGTSTDFDGNYKMSIDPGTYDVEFSYIGYSSVKVTGVVVKAGQSNKLDGDLGGDDGITYCKMYGWKLNYSLRGTKQGLMKVGFLKDPGLIFLINMVTLRPFLVPL